MLYQHGDLNLVTAYTTHQYLEELHQHLRIAFAQQQLQRRSESLVQPSLLQPNLLQPLTMSSISETKCGTTASPDQGRMLPIVCQISSYLTGQDPTRS